MDAAFGHVLAVMVLSIGAGVASFLGPPCMSPLGLQLEVNQYSLTFELAASSGDANDIRMNGPRSWTPEHVSGSFLEINISQPVLLTGLQVQGDPQQTGQIYGWYLDTSQDCETYQTENYSLDPLSPVYTQTVHLKSVQFVSCIRLRPTQFKGKSPALRLELFGCVIADSSVCDRDVHPVSEMWIESGGRQLTFLHEIVISWVKILLDLKAYGDTGDAGIFYSRSCDSWHYYEPDDTSVISVTSPDQTSSWMTIDLDKPVRAKCLRIFPPFSTTLKEVHTSGCSSHVTTSLHEIPRNKTKVYETDITGYQEDAPNVAHDQMAGGDAEQMPTVIQVKKKPSISPENSKTNAKPAQKQQDVDKAGAATKIVTGDSHVQITIISVEVSAASTTTISEAGEDIVTPLQIGEEVETTEDSPTKSPQESAAVNSITVSYNTEGTKGHTQNETQSNEVNYNFTSTASLRDNMAAEQTNLVNTTMSNNMSDAGVVMDAGQVTEQSVENNTIGKESNNRNITMGFEVNSNGSTTGLPEKLADTSSDPPTTVQLIVSTTLVHTLGMGVTVVQQPENDTASIQSDNHSPIIQTGNDSLITDSEINSSVFELENNTSSVAHTVSNSSTIHPEGNDSSNRTERNRSDTNDWWRTNCGIKGGARGYRKKRVISGQRNVPGEWPWLVSMHFLPPTEFTEQSGFKHLCGASLIAPSWILTAAHCFEDNIIIGLSGVRNWRIYLGMHDLARGDDQNCVQERLIDTVYIYPSYNVFTNLLIYDIALVKLNEPVDYSDRVSPICLDDTYVHYGEIPCYVSGWGQLFTNSSGTRFPYTASLSTLSPASCKRKYDMLPEEHPVKSHIRIEPPVLCAAVGSNGEDACQGDSGGPLMCQHDGRWFQAGVVAAGYLCGNEATPGLYSRVSYYFDWIRETMEDNDGI